VSSPITSSTRPFGTSTNLRESFSFGNAPGAAYLSLGSAPTRSPLSNGHGLCHFVTDQTNGDNSRHDQRYVTCIVQLFFSPLTATCVAPGAVGVDACRVEEVERKASGRRREVELDRERTRETRTTTTSRPPQRQQRDETKRHTTTSLHPPPRCHALCRPPSTPTHSPSRYTTPKSRFPIPVPGYLYPPTHTDTPSPISRHAPNGRCHQVFFASTTPPSLELALSPIPPSPIDAAVD
jgi:hypothetical protein